MKLTRLRTKNLHGALNLDILFNSELNLIVGINGSGKTSALNAIDWMIKPNLGKLSLTRFDSIILDFEFKSVAHKITAEKTDAKLTILLNVKGKDKYQPITVNLNRMPTDLDEEQLLEYYSRLTPEKHEQPFWKFLSELPNPTVISLERSISAETEENIYYDIYSHEQRPSVRRRTAIGEVQRITSELYAEFRRKAIEYDDELKSRIIMTALQGPEDEWPGAFQVPTIDDTETLETKVISYLAGSIKSVDVASEVKKFFAYFRSLTQDQGIGPGDDTHFARLLVAQYARIDRLAQAFNEYDTRIAQAFQNLGTYLTRLNRFFIDTGKKLEFDQSTSMLVFRLGRGGDQSDFSKGEQRSIANLSSGEKQILILLTFVAFSTSPQSLFIIDEPELSLHPKWQSDFLDALLALKPDGIQLLVATHSPDIVGKRKDAVIPFRSKTQE